MRALALAASRRALLREAGEPVGLYTALIALGSALILLLELPVALRLRDHSSYPIIATGYALVGVGFVLFGMPVSAAAPLCLCWKG